MIPPTDICSQSWKDQIQIQNRLTKPAQQSVHPTSGSRRVFRQFTWLGVGSVKMALSRPAHQRVTQAVGRYDYELGENTAMKIDEIKLLCEYNDWADARMLAACARVSPEQYAAPTSYGRGGLRETMVHILDNIWQQRITLQGYYQEALAEEADYDATELHEDAFPTFAA